MIYDCFMFWNELEVLEIRLNVLSDVVDRFVLVESRTNHQGEPKPLVFEANKGRFAPFLDRIEHLVYDAPPAPSDVSRDILARNWQAENRQRNDLMRGLRDARPSDHIILSDLDEIPSPQAVRRAVRMKGVTVCRLRSYYFYLNLRNCNEPFWEHGPKICTVAELTDPRTFEGFEYSVCCPKSVNGQASLTMLRHCKPRNVIRNAGWHFSYVGGRAIVRAKLRAIADGRTPMGRRLGGLAEGLNEPDWSLRMANSGFFLDRLGSGHPRYLVENRERYGEMILPHPGGYGRRTALRRARTVSLVWASYLARRLVPMWVKRIVWRVASARSNAAPREPSVDGRTVEKKRLLYVTSKPHPWSDSQDSLVHFQNAPYSIDAIGYRLSQRGWAVGWAGRKLAANPFRLARQIDEFRPDYVYTYGSTVALHPLFCRRFLCRHKAFKVVHGWDDHYDRVWGEMFGWPGRLLMKWMEKRIVRWSDRVVTLSYALRNLGRSYGVECHYIPNGADPVDRSRVRGELKLEGRFRLVYTGDKARWKKTEDICLAMRSLPKDIRLYLTGNNEKWLEPYASENCVFLGWLSREEQMNVMSQADAFVVTSDQDCNAKLQEYLRWQKPILGYDGEANLLFRNGRNALLTKDYPTAVRRLADDPQLCETLARNAATDIPVYSWAEIAEQFERYFLSL